MNNTKILSVVFTLIFAVFARFGAGSSSLKSAESAYGFHKFGNGDAWSVATHSSLVPAAFQLTHVADSPFVLTVAFETHAKQRPAMRVENMQMPTAFWIYWLDLKTLAVAASPKATFSVANGVQFVQPLSNAVIFVIATQDLGTLQVDVTAMHNIYNAKSDVIDGTRYDRFVKEVLVPAVDNRAFVFLAYQKGKFEYFLPFPAKVLFGLFVVLNVLAVCWYIFWVRSVDCKRKKCVSSASVEVAAKSVSMLQTEAASVAAELPMASSSSSEVVSRAASPSSSVDSSLDATQSPV